MIVRKTIDVLIAAFCITEDHRLLHCDRDFDAFEHHLGLRVLHPWFSRLWCRTRYYANAFRLGTKYRT